MVPTFLTSLYPGRHSLSVPLIVILMLFPDIGFSLIYVKVKYSVDTTNDCSSTFTLNCVSLKVLFTTSDVALSSKRPF